MRWPSSPTTVSSETVESMTPAPSPHGVDPIAATRMSLARIASELQQIDAQLAALAVAPPSQPGAAERWPGHLLKMSEASEYLGVPVQTLRSWRAGGKGPRSGKIGRRVSYRVTDLDAWLEEQFRA